MDNTLQSQPEIRSIDNEDRVSVLHHVRHAVGYERLSYAVYTLLGILFYGMGIFTLLGFILYAVNGSPLLSPAPIVYSCYVLLNCLVGYGFIFHRKWLITAFGTMTVFMGSMVGFFHYISVPARGKELLVNASVALIVLFFLLATRKLLSGGYFSFRTVVPFAAALLLSFVLTNPIMLK